MSANIEKVKAEKASGTPTDKIEEDLVNSFAGKGATYPNLSVDELVKAFEILVPNSQAKAQGSVYTPESITEFMAREAIEAEVAKGKDPAKLTFFDPAVGCGALLVAAMKVLVEHYGQNPRTIMDRLYGVDINADSVRRAHLLLNLVAKHWGGSGAAHLVQADALEETWKEDLGKGDFDIVLANPPYVRYQELDQETRKTLAARWQSCGTGNYNLYFAFLELGWKACTGTLAVIAPNGWLDSLSARPLRSWAKNTQGLESLVNFGHHKVFEVLTYTAISFWDKQHQSEEINYVELAGLDGLAQLGPNWREEKAAAQTLPAGKEWKLVTRANQSNLRALQKAQTTLGTQASVRYGIATCRDRLYLLDGRRDEEGNYLQRLGKDTYAIEADLVRPIVKASAIKDQATLNKDPGAAIYPYTLKDGKASIIDEQELNEQYPKALAYFKAIRGQLEERDKGAKTYASWYAYARTQGLVPAGPKLVSPLYAASPRFLLDERKNSLLVNGVSVTVKADAEDWVSLDLLALILNSGITHYFIEATSKAIDGGFFAYQKTQVEALPLIKLEAEQVQELKDADPAKRNAALAQSYGIVLPTRYQST